jgi:two-component system, chemotaxis family, CheB/CheR fusion protein
VKSVCDDLFIHVTDFFRDSDSFEGLKKHIFPVISKSRLPDTPLRIWVPGCSTGEEAYSIAISFLEFSAQHKLKVPLQIFATDISEKALAKRTRGFVHKLRCGWSLQGAAGQIF